MSGGLDDFLALYLCTALHQMLDFCTDLHADEQMHPLDPIFTTYSSLFVSLILNCVSILNCEELRDVRRLHLDLPHLELQPLQPLDEHPRVRPRPSCGSRGG